MRGARGPRHDGVHHRRRQRLIDDIAKQVLQTIANVVKAQQDNEGDAGSALQHQQRLAAVARDEPVKHLQHEDRRRQK